MSRVSASENDGEASSSFNRKHDTDRIPAIVLPTENNENDEDAPLTDDRIEGLRRLLATFAEHLDNPDVADIIADFEAETLLLTSDAGIEVGDTDVDVGALGDPEDPNCPDENRYD
jgi:hypothetical protein